MAAAGRQYAAGGRSPGGPIQLEKLAAQAGLPEEDVRAALTAIKLKAGAAAVSAVEAGGVAGDALHFFMDCGVVYVEEARRADNVGAFFVNQMRFVRKMEYAGALAGWVPSVTPHPLPPPLPSSSLAQVNRGINPGKATWGGKR